jgi:hypothetical protein
VWKSFYVSWSLIYSSLQYQAAGADCEAFHDVVCSGLLLLSFLDSAIALEVFFT